MTDSNILYIEEDRVLLKVYPNRDIDYFIVLDPENQHHKRLRRKEHKNRPIWEKRVSEAHWIRIESSEAQIWEERYKSMIRS